MAIVSCEPSTQFTHWTGGLRKKNKTKRKTIKKRKEKKKGTDPFERAGSQSKVEFKAEMAEAQARKITILIKITTTNYLVEINCVRRCLISFQVVRFFCFVNSLAFLWIFCFFFLLFIVFFFGIFLFFSFFLFLVRGRLSHVAPTQQWQEKWRSTRRSVPGWMLLGFYWVFPGFTGFYRVLLGFTGFYRVLLGFTEFYWVLLGFT